MAGKKVPSITDELVRFKDVILKSGFDIARQYNQTLYVEGPKGGLIVKIDQGLWNAIMEDPEMKSWISELDISKPEDRDIIDKFNYCENDGGWLEIDSEKIYAGAIIHITIESLSYQVPINKNLFIVKFKKSDTNNFTYKLLTVPRLSLVLRKTYEGKVENSNWSIYRVFQVL